MSEDRPERFFKVMLRAGRLHLVDIPDWEPWYPARLVYRSDTEVAWIMRIDRGVRAARTRQELDDALAASRQSGRALVLYVHESLTREVAVRWQHARREVETEVAADRAREMPA